MQAMNNRKALVVGIGSYKWSSLLKNSTNDAADMKEKLSEMGFEVTHLEDCNTDELDKVSGDFTDCLCEGDIGVFYFAGTRTVD